MKGVTPAEEQQEKIQNDITEKGLQNADLKEDGNLTYEYFIALHTLITNWHLEMIFAFRKDQIKKRRAAIDNKEAY